MGRRVCERCGGALPRLARRDARSCSTACRVALSRARRVVVPAVMRGAGRWVRHVAKRPVTVSGAPASSTNSGTWATHEAAVRSKVGDGLGFVLGAGFACIDIDHCLVNGRPDARAQRLLDANPGAFVEVSPGGDGLHIWGTAPEGPGRKSPEFEFYSVGRYITVTGRVFQQGGLIPLRV